MIHTDFGGCGGLQGVSGCGGVPGDVDVNLLVLPSSCVATHSAHFRSAH